MSLHFALCCYSANLKTDQSLFDRGLTPRRTPVFSANFFRVCQGFF
jgi:hypothetical protein